MANIKAKLGNVDISNYLRVNEGEGLDFGSVDFLSPGFSDSALFEGQSLVNVQAKNKEIEIPLYVSAAPAGTTPLTNLCPNPNFNIDLTGWVTTSAIFPSGALISRVAGGAVGPYCMKVQLPRISVNEGAGIALPGQFEAGVTYTASVWLKGLAGGEQVQLYFGDLTNFIGGVNATQTTVTLTTSWQRFSITFAPTVNDSNMSVIVNNPGSSPAMTYFVSGVQVTQTAAAVNYFDGDSKGALWNGPPTTSTSTQVIGSDGLHSLIAAVNRELRKVNDLGLPLTLEWNNAQATNSTFFQVQFGRFEPSFVFRVTERGWLAGKLHLWTYPYGNTATQRSLGTYTATGAAMVASAPLLAAANAKQEILNDQPVAYYRFGEAPQSKPTLVDFMGVAHGQYGPSAAVTLGVTGPLQPGDTNTGAKFDGASGCATVPDQAAIRLVAPFTLMTWVNQINPTTAAGVQTIVAKGPSNDFEWRTDNGVPNLLFGAGAPGAAISFLPLNVWNHIAVSYDGAGVVYYLNGRVDATRAIATSVPTSLGAMCIGSDQGIRHFNGSLDELCMFPKVLSPQRIQQHYLAGPRPNALQGDVGAQVEAYAVAGSYVPDDGRIVVMSALPDPAYQAIWPAASMALDPGATLLGASGAYASQMALIGAGNARTVGRIFLTPGSVYAGDNRILALVRTQGLPMTLQALDLSGNPIGFAQPSQAYDWQLVDFGILRVPTWTATSGVQITLASLGASSSASQYVPQGPPSFDGAHGNSAAGAVGLSPIFVLPEARTELFADLRSQLVSYDSFRTGLGGAVTPLASSLDLLGNVWTHNQGTTMCQKRTLDGVNGTGAAGDKFEQLLIGTYMTDCVVSVSIPAQAQQGGADSVQVGLQAGAVVLGPTYMTFAGTSGAPSISIIGWPAGGELIFKRIGGTMTGIFQPGPLAGIASPPIQISLGGQATVPSQPAFQYRASSSAPPMLVSGFRARALRTAAGSYQAREVYRLSDAQKVNTRQNPSGADWVDLSYGARGQVGVLPVPSAGGGVFVGVFPFDQGPMNDVMTAELRVRERFTYAR